MSKNNTPEHDDENTEKVLDVFVYTDDFESNSWTIILCKSSPNISCNIWMHIWMQ